MSLYMIDWSMKWESFYWQSGWKTEAYAFYFYMKDMMTCVSIFYDISHANPCVTCRTFLWIEFAKLWYCSIFSRRMVEILQQRISIFGNFSYKFICHNVCSLNNENILTVWLTNFFSFQFHLISYKFLVSHLYLLIRNPCIAVRPEMRTQCPKSNGS